MKLKYYLRGLGIGIIGTAIVMGIALSGKKETLSDAEIIERARLLGMEMEGELGPDKKDPEQENLEGQEPGTAPEGETGQDEGNSGSGEEGEEGSGEDGGESSSSPGPDKAESNPPDSGDGVQQPSGSSGDVVKFEIKEGEFSDVVSRKLFQAGLIPDADKFNAYMTQKGADDSLRIGTHLIPMGASADEIIDILEGTPQ